MDESNSSTKQQGRLQSDGAKTGNLPESGGNVPSAGEGIAGGAALGDGVQTLLAEPSSSPGVATSNFDLLAALQEAEQFALAVKGFADLIPDPRWQAISKAMDIAIQAHDRMNQARSNQ